MELAEVKLPWFERRVWAIGGVLFLLLATSFVSLRTFRNFAEPSREFDWESRGMSDFYTLFNYSKAFADGVNPYSTDVMQHPEYIVPRSAAPFSPFAFLPYVPLTFLPLKVASVVFFVSTWMLFGVLARLCIAISRIKFDWVLWVWVFGFLVFSRPGHVTLFTGYFTVQLAIGVVVALHYAKSNPWLAGVGFLFAAVKPTYAIPLTILMLARRDFKAVAIGVALTSMIAIGCFGWLASFSDFPSVVEGIQAGQQAFHDDPTESPVNTWTRIDVAGIVAKGMNRVPGTAEYLGVMLLLLIVPCVAIWKASSRETDSGAGGLTALIVVLALLVTIYHHSYDCLIAAAILFAMLLNSRRLIPAVPRYVAIATAVLLAVPMLNYVSTRAARNALAFEQSDWLWQAITTVNGISLTLALLIAIWFAFKLPLPRQEPV
ncbi:glycosyltransferase family 87 protein [Mariniblastus fucicola]|uniref:Polyprenol-phosphate-mannose-dependent alpha-(1-2)-phosphatidylinositol mannoside mannosyltransferase n=1 Tax=Mariniblastus fucicola TaxID=980251 RepID=A0A5B9P944_9BACT|nr:glycosyltransferase family 87 protein [Mariniblastus fucicola]QEG23267.1 hypothetical protein MFFC18_31630 [Mariniblastus fucicola]